MSKKTKKRLILLAIVVVIVLGRNIYQKRKHQRFLDEANAMLVRLRGTEFNLDTKKLQEDYPGLTFKEAVEKVVDPTGQYRGLYNTPISGVDALKPYCPAMVKGGHLFYRDGCMEVSYYIDEDTEGFNAQTIIIEFYDDGRIYKRYRGEYGAVTDYKLEP